MATDPVNLAADGKEAELRRIVQPMIRPLITILSSAVQASADLNLGLPIGHHEQNIEDALVQVVKIAAELDGKSL